ncbi:hypothetical protein GCM10009785_21530 [Brooklawnia cerclae]|uniref:Uncharacterized protein n=1 Tax=Brooklawnia cerclae TaxID=349934 RepID=A0ABX0SIM6_9ACTN|nr:hypothetical protein [Brooklawnia cerclae]NIH58243.1 hypothetical protein [Brooklawnia cerclae]
MYGLVKLMGARYREAARELAAHLNDAHSNDPLMYDARPDSFVG